MLCRFVVWQLAVAVIPEDPIFLDPGRENSLGSSTASAAYRTQLEAIISNVQAQMAADRKTSALKQLQGTQPAAAAASSSPSLLFRWLAVSLTVAALCCRCGVQGTYGRLATRRASCRERCTRTPRSR